MRILVLSFYYSPDIGPGSLRAKSLVDILKVQEKSVCIDVMTTFPNRYDSINLDAQELEADNNVYIYRFQLPSNQSNMYNQAIGFLKFGLSVLKQTKNKKYDVVVATSSRLFTAALGAYVSKKTKAKLYLDIRDLFIDTIKDLLKSRPQRIIIPALRILERWTFNRANKINIVSGGFLPYFNKFSLKCDLTVFTNGIDYSFVNTDFRKNTFNHNPVILYAGNMGQGQGLEKIIPKAIKKLKKSFNFILVGDGRMRKVLEDELNLNDINSIILLRPMQRKRLISLYTEADILFLHLNNFFAFTKVLPSKIFEYAATGKPILAGVSGFAAEFLNKNVTGVFIFEPHNVDQMEKSLKTLMKGPTHYDRCDFINEYMRDDIMKKMAYDILSL